MYPRPIEYEGIFNFRDLGGYKTRGGRTVAWRRLFRSGELHHMTGRDLTRLKEETGITSVIDLRNVMEPKQNHEISFLDNAGIHYYNVPFDTGTDYDFIREKEQYLGHSQMGEVYIWRIKHKNFGENVVDALEVIANANNHPLLFHCAAGKDRSGILAAIILGVLGVADEDIVEDYTLTAPYMKELFKRWENDLEMVEIIRGLPAYTWEAAPESMALFLSGIRKKYGSVRGYLEAQGADR